MNVVFRADDAGSSEGANRAIVETVREGVVRNVSVMVPGPAFDHAVSLLRDLPADLGLHVTLNAEWNAPKWRPILSSEAVPSLVEPAGWFTQNPGVLHARGFSMDEAMAEVAAQLAKARAVGLEIAYVDEHMGVGWISPGKEGEETLTERLRDFAQQEGLVYAGLPFLDAPWSGPDDLVETLARQTGPSVFVGHPGSDDDPVMASFVHEGLEAGRVHRERVFERRLLTHLALARAVREGRIRSRTYRELA